MITRPLDLASRLRPPPRGLEWLFVVNVALVALFFALFGSRFVLAPGLALDFRLPAVAGSAASARTTTHVISVITSGQVFTPDGLTSISDLGRWLASEAGRTRNPRLLVRAGADVPTSVLADVAAAAAAAGFGMVWAVGEPVAAGNGPVGPR
jgi:biopolymer transport protein ExbD